MKHTKPTMSWATDQNHLNEQLAKYWQREYEELVSACSVAGRLIGMNEDADSMEACSTLMEAINWAK